MNKTFQIGVIPGDGTGPEVIEEGLKVLKAVAQNTPLKRVGTAEDIAAAAVFLCGDGATFITGEIIEINGGLWVA